MRPRRAATGARTIAEGVFCLPLGGCNVYLVGTAARWALIDTGWAKSANAIREAAELARVWKTPIYAHPDDLPYLQGGVLPEDLLDPVGRVFNAVTRVLPRRTVERMTSSSLKDIVRALPTPEEGVPGLPDWEYVHVPGHSPGHVVFFRRRDRVLIAGDGVLTAPLWG